MAAEVINALVFFFQSSSKKIVLFPPKSSIPPVPFPELREIWGGGEWGGFFPKVIQSPASSSFSSEISGVIPTPIQTEPFRRSYKLNKWIKAKIQRSSQFPESPHMFSTQMGGCIFLHFFQLPLSTSQ